MEMKLILPDLFFLYVVVIMQSIISQCGILP